jgi:phage-related protein
MSSLSKGAGIAGLAIGGLLVGGLIDSVHAAMSAQVAQASLDTAIKSTGQSLAQAGPQIDSAAAAARNLGFSNIEAETSLGKLEMATRSTKSSISDLSIAENLARARHIDLATATQMLVGAQNGNTRAARQLGVQIIPVTTAVDALKAAHVGVKGPIDAVAMAQAKLQDKMATGAATVAAISERVKGQGAAYASTAAGGMARFSAQTDYIKESLGKALLPILGSASAALATFTGFLAANPGVMKLVLVGVGALAAVLITASIASKVMTAVQTIGTVASKGFAAAQWLVNAALDANPIGIIIIALAALAVGLYIAWNHSNEFRDIVKGAFKDVTKVVSDFAAFFTKDIPDAFKTIIGWVRANWPIILTVISGPFAPLVALALNAFGIRSALVTAFQGIISDVTGAMSSVINAITSGASGLGAIVYNGIVGGLGDLAGSIFNWISNAIGTALSALGAAAQQIGTWIWQGAQFLGNLAGDIFNWVANSISVAAGDIAATATRIGAWIYASANNFGNLAGDILNWVAGNISAAAGGISGTASRIGSWIYNGANNFGNLGGDILHWVAGSVSAAAGGAYGAAMAIGSRIASGASAGLHSISGAVSGLATGAINAIRSWWNSHMKGLGHFHVSIPFDGGFGWGGLPGLFAGGIVTQPTVALIGERGPEAVVPLSGPHAPRVSPLPGMSAPRTATASAGGGDTYHYNITVQGFVGSEAQLSQKLADLLVGHGRRHPGALGGLA